MQKENNRWNAMVTKIQVSNGLSITLSVAKEPKLKTIYLCRVVTLVMALTPAHAPNRLVTGIHFSFLF